MMDQQHLLQGVIAKRGMEQGPVGWGSGSQVLTPTEPDACLCTPLGNALQSRDLG